MRITKALKTFFTVATTVLLLSVMQSAHARIYQSDPRALSLHEVELIGLDANMCMLGIRKEMSKEGFLVTDNLRVPDAVLEVKVQTNGSLHDHSKIEKLHYSAVLVGAGERVLFAKGGYEDARNLEEVCEDIGDDIADDMAGRLT